MWKIRRNRIRLYGSLATFSIVGIHIMCSKIIVGGGKRDCYYETFKKDQKFEIEYQASLNDSRSEHSHDSILRLSTGAT